MKRLAFLGLCLTLCLAAMLTTPLPAAADCHENCCSDAQQDVERYCAALGSYVTYFYCYEGYMGSCCAVWYDCAPPPV